MESGWSEVHGPNGGRMSAGLHVSDCVSGSRSLQTLPDSESLIFWPAYIASSAVQA